MPRLSIGVLLYAASLLGCTTICPSSWETGVSVGHSALYGQTYETTVSVGGELGEKCLKKDE